MNHFSMDEKHSSKLNEKLSTSKRKRLENFLKGIVDRHKPLEDEFSLENSQSVSNIQTSHELNKNKTYVRNVNTGSDTQLCNNKISASTLSLNTVQQKFLNFLPNSKKQNSKENFPVTKLNSAIKYSNLRKCETTSAIPTQISIYEEISEDNKMNSCEAFCKRSISVNVPELKNFHVNHLNKFETGKCLETNSYSHFNENKEKGNSIQLSHKNINKPKFLSGQNAKECDLISSSTNQGNDFSIENDVLYGTTICKLCLSGIKNNQITKIKKCQCYFCTNCMKFYIEHEIRNGTYDISCPDARCKFQGKLSLAEIASLVSTELIEKHHRFRLNTEIEMDDSRMWCTRAGCETVCFIDRKLQKSNTEDEDILLSKTSKTFSENENLFLVTCPTCNEEFCSNCKRNWHPSLTCDQNKYKLLHHGALEDIKDFKFKTDSIKFCPMCGVPIEKDSGCAQMMCKRCKHVFCWYCLKSLDDDFLLRHYDSGPCKNKLGHSRVSVLWHRTQVIGIFAGFGILLVIASPLLLLAVPCIICCKCQRCTNDETKHENDVEFEEVPLKK